ncbi:MAG TPA: hypothetical protein VI687_01905 [Candidatus Limnocylindrales bacterium]|nr:hypothetical protein [Candidatus Limnocylindrales bacterium]
MSAVTRVLSTSINPGRLMQEFVAVFSFGCGISWDGYQYGERQATVDVTAPVPGQIRVFPPIELTPAQITVLDNVLAAHNAAVLSDDQVRQDQDVADLVSLRTALTNWDTLTNAQRNAALKLAVRLLLRTVRGDAI